MCQHPCPPPQMQTWSVSRSEGSEKEETALPPGSGWSPISPPGTQLPEHQWGLPCPCWEPEWAGASPKLCRHQPVPSRASVQMVRQAGWARQAVLHLPGLPSHRPP